MVFHQKSLYIVILAGGSGTRFWPMSREDKPKQFLNIIGEQSLLQQTIGRVSPPIDPSRIYIVSNKAHLKKISEYTRRWKIPGANILLEPSGKNTAPAIAWAAAVIHRRDPQAVMVVLPSDHLISHRAQFWKCLQEAVCLAEDGHLVTMGIVPTRPETGYGYLKTRMERRKGKQICRVEKFTEKPSLETARKFLKTKKYFWNSGMFVWKCSTVLKQFQQHLPDVARAFERPLSSSNIVRVWKALPSISIDYGILEKANDVVAIPAADIGWSDVGSWEALYEVSQKDSDGNVYRGRVISLDCRNTMVHANERLVAAVGLEDVIIIETAAAILICPRSLSQRVREITALQKGLRIR